MSLDVYLELDSAVPRNAGSGIFIRENGATREISREEWNVRFPGSEPIVAAADYEDSTVYSRNITHNLNVMADAAGIYKHLWRPEEIGIAKAVDLIDPLTEGLERLRSDPTKFKALNPPNGWGDYDGLVAFVDDYRVACRKYPTANVKVSR